MRFFIAACLMIISTGPWVLFQDQIISHARQSVTTSVAYCGYIHGTVYSANACFIFLFCAIVLGFGGLGSERSRGTAQFTLSLPVSRSLLVVSQLLTGLLEIAVLAMLPGFVILCISPFVARAYPSSQAFQFSLLWFLCGSLWLGVSFMISILAEKEYASVVLSISVFLAYLLLITSAFRVFTSWDMFRIMTGSGLSYFQHNLLSIGNSKLAGEIALVLIAGTLACIVISIEITKQKDY